MRVWFSSFVGLLWLQVTVIASAHHSFAAEFDINRPLSFTGAVTRIEWTNPHAWIFMDVEDEQQNTQAWAVELLGINNLMRRGLTRNKLKAGDVITVEGFGARDGSNTANASAVTMAETGEVLWESAARDRN
jgi:hypothetical protein